MNFIMERDDVTDEVKIGELIITTEMYGCKLS